MLRAEAVVDLDAIRDNVATLKAGTLGRGDGGRQGRRLRPRPARRVRAPRSPAARPGSARRRSTRRSRCVVPGIDVPALAWLWTPGETETRARRDRRRHRPVGEQPVAARRSSRRRPRDRAHRAGPPEDRHRAVAQRLLRRRLARPRPRSRRASDAVARRRHLEPLRVRRRARPPDDRQAARRVPRGARRRRVARRAAAGAAHRQLGRHADPARGALRPGPSRHRGLRADAGARSRASSGSSRR